MHVVGPQDHHNGVEIRPCDALSALPDQGRLAERGRGRDRLQPRKQPWGRRAEGVAYHYWPVCKDNKTEQNESCWVSYAKTGADLVILARYMQVLSDDLSTRLFGKLINIHHSFLPSFKGAKPYHQAYERRVKLIGATAHYVTPDLDEGPIIDQETERVTHAMSAEDLVAAGRDIESRVLARAVKLHLERRILLNGNKIIVFSS